jgi:hypothetical protein
MSHDMPHEATQHSPAAATAGNGAPPFSAEEQAMLHEEDRKAGRNIVVLMLSIFTFGLIGYIAIAIWVR